MKFYFVYGKRLNLTNDILFFLQKTEESNCYKKINDISQLKDIDFFFFDNRKIFIVFMVDKTSLNIDFEQIKEDNKESNNVICFLSLLPPEESIKKFFIIREAVSYKEPIFLEIFPECPKNKIKKLITFFNGQNYCFYILKNILKDLKWNTDLFVYNNKKNSELIQKVRSSFFWKQNFTDDKIKGLYTVNELEKIIFQAGDLIFLENYLEICQNRKEVPRFRF
jgi:hypothetical protein